MKILSLRVLLLLSALAASPLAAASSYLAEGVDASNLLNSSRFYDNGKGWYWQWSKLGSELDALYAENGNSASFLGDLAGYLADGPAADQSFRDYVFSKLGDDRDTCWYNVSANVIQYWQSYYGVFYQGADPLPYGHTYDKQYLSRLGGTQSLKVDMLFYDNYINDGGNFIWASNWYFRGVTTGANKPSSSDNAFYGYFDSYFSGSANRYTPISTNDTAQSMAGVLATHFGGHLDANGDFVKDTVGQIAYLGLGVKGDDAGHALTCYGFEVLGNDVIKLQLTNSDDLEYRLFEAYARKDADGLFCLYNDADCSSEWTYSGRSWYINALDSVQTPQSLQEMYAQYMDKDNAMVWNGHLDSWEETYEAATTEELPTEKTGWDVYAASGSHKGFFHSYYDAGRVTEFGDHAVNTNVSVSGPVSSGGIVISATQKDYVFSGSNGARITTGDIRLTGARKASFADISISAAHVAVGSGSTATLSLGSGASLSADSVRVARLATFELNGGAASIASGGVTLDSGATLAIAAPSTLTVQAGGALVAGDGAVFSFTLPQGSSATPLLTYTGAFTLGGSCSFVFNGATPHTNDSFALIQFTDPSMFSSGWLSRIGVEDGSLSYSGGILTYTYTDPGTLTWTTGAGSWNADSWDHGATATANRNVEFTATGSGGDIAISGEVSPGRILVSGGLYHFTGDGSIAGRSDVTVKGSSAALDVGVSMENRHIKVQEGASVSFSKAGGSTIECLTTESGTTATFSQEYTVKGSTALNGDLSLVGSATLNLDLDNGMALNGAISSVAGTTLKFSNSSSLQDIAYSLAGDTSAMAGSVIVGDEADAWGTTLKVSANPVSAGSGRASASYALAGKGTLELSGNTDTDGFAFTNSVTGTGTLKVAKGALIQFGLDSSGKASFDSGLTFEVEGTANLGGSSYCLKREPIAKHVIVDGGTLNLTYADEYLQSVKATDKLTLGNNATVNVDFCFRVNPIITEADMQGNATIFMARPALGSYSLSRNININKLTGSGNLTLASGVNILSKFKLASTENHSGAITVQSDPGNSDYDDCAIVTSLELADGFDSAGTITLNSGSGYSRASSLGIAGNAAVGGLTGDAAAFLYSGTLYEYEAVSWSRAYNYNVPYSNFQNAVDSQESTLTINVQSGEYDFKGGVVSAGTHTTYDSQGEPIVRPTGLNLRKLGAGKQIFSGNMSDFKSDVAVEEGTLSFALQAALAVDDLVIKGGATLEALLGIKVSGTYTTLAGINIQSMSRRAANNIPTPQFRTTSTAIADLDLSAATKLSLAALTDMGTKNLTLRGDGTYAFTLDWGALNNLPQDGQKGDLTLFSNIGTLVVGGETMADGWSILAKKLLNADWLTDKNELVFVGSSLVLTNLGSVPEPATATLGMLALAMLAARRRRQRNGRA